MEWHGKIAVKASGRVYGHRHGIDQVGYAEAAAEKVSQRAFHRGRAFAVPKDSYNQVTQDVAVSWAGLVGYGHPDVLDDLETIFVEYLPHLKFELDYIE